MELVNATRMAVACTMGLEPNGRELLVIVIKGSFVLPAPGEPVRLADVQRPLAMADTFTGAPGLSAPVREADFSPRKRRCDLLLLGTAYAPGGRPAARVPVGLKVGSLSKRFAVVGARQWESSLSGIRVSSAQPFVAQRISYDVAFGGSGLEHEDPSKRAVFMSNPVGRGFHLSSDAESIDGKPLPSTEELDRPVCRPNEDYRPMAFGPLGRGWEPRCRYAGTYDGDWLEHCCPFLPPDFDERYYQAAPSDQQLPFPTADLDVVLVNLTPDGKRSFSLPNFRAPIYIFPSNGGRENHEAALDTVEFDPDHDRITMTWRLARPLKKNMFEIAQVLVGRKGREWWQLREEVAFPIDVVTATLPHNRATVTG